MTRTLALHSERWQSRDTEMLLFLWPGEHLVSVGTKTSAWGDGPGGREYPTDRAVWFPHSPYLYEQPPLLFLQA